MSSSTVSKPIPDVQAQSLRFAELIEQGNVKEGLQLFDSIKGELPEKFSSRVPRLVQCLQKFEGTADWEMRSKEMGAIFRSYVEMFSKDGMLGPVHNVVLGVTEHSYNHFHAPVLFVMQNQIINTFREDARNFPFLVNHFIPALHEFLTTGCMEKLQLVMQSIHENGLDFADLFQEILKDRSLLSKPVCSFLPEGNFPCFDLGQMQKTWMEEEIPFWKVIVQLLGKEKTTTAKESLDKLTGRPDQSVRKANIVKAFDGLSPHFIYLLKNTQNKAHEKITECKDLLRLCNKFLFKADMCTFGQYTSQMEFALSLYRQVKQDLIFYRDLNLLVLTYNLKDLQKEWQTLREKNPTTVFYQFMQDTVKREITDVMSGPPSDKQKTLGARRLEFYKSNPSFSNLEKFTKLFVDMCDFDTQMFKGLFTLPFEMGRLMGISEDWEDDAPPAQPKTFDTDEKKAPPRQEDAPALSPSASTPNPLPKKESPPLPLTTTREGLTEFMQRMFAPNRAPYGLPVANRALMNGLLQFDNLTALFERLTDHPDNIFPTVALIGSTAATCIEKLEEGYLLANELPFPADCHNLVRLSNALPFLLFSDVEAVSSINFAERHVRYIGGVSARDRLTHFQKALREIMNAPALVPNMARIERLFSRILPLLHKLLHRGEPPLINMGDVMQRVRAHLQEPATIAELPPRHGEIMAITERLAKLIDSMLKNEAYQKKLTNLLRNYLIRLRVEAIIHPRPAGMRIHYSTLFQLLPRIAEELIKLLFIHRKVERNPVSFNHKLLEMMSAAGIKLPKSKAQLEKFLERVSVYAKMDRYPAKAKYKHPQVKAVADHIKAVQGKAMSPITEGWTPVSAHDKAFPELEKALIQEFALLEEFAAFILSLLQKKD